MSWGAWSFAMFGTNWGFFSGENSAAAASIAQNYVKLAEPVDTQQTEVTAMATSIFTKDLVFVTNRNRVW